MLNEMLDQFVQVFKYFNIGCRNKVPFNRIK